MSERQDKIDFDFERIFKDPRLKDDPVVRSCKKTYDEGNKFRDTYTGLRMAMIMGDHPKAAAFISYLTNYLSIASLNIAGVGEEILQIELAKEAKEKNDKKASERERETLRWIEEAEANDSND